MLLSLHHFFVIWVKDPNGEKEIKVLGVGFGERPFFKRVLPNYAVYTPRQTRICLFYACDGEGVALHFELDLEACKGKAVDALFVILIRWARVKG